MGSSQVETCFINALPIMRGYPFYCAMLLTKNEEVHEKEDLLFHFLHHISTGVSLLASDPSPVRPFRMISVIMSLSLSATPGC